MDMEEEAQGSSGCLCQRTDFLPEKSFESWSSYARALKDTPARFANRVMVRAVEQAEMHEVKARSQHEMTKTLTWWDLICFSFGSAMGAGVYVLAGTEARNDAGPGVVISYIISGLSAMLSVFCYTEFAVEVPVAGGAFAYLRLELGDFVAFIAAGNILLEYVIGSAAVARSFTYYFATLFNRSPYSFRIHIHDFKHDYSHLDPMALALILVVCVITTIGIKGSSRLNYISAVMHMVVIVFIIFVGLSKADVKNYLPFSPYGPNGIIKASSVLFFAYLGFDAVTTMAEETKNPAKDIPVGLVGSMAIISFVSCLMSITLCLMQPYSSLDESAAFSVAFEQVGVGWAKYVVALGGIMGMVTVLITSAIGQARYLTHIARTHMVPPWLARVNSRTGTPINATISTAVIAATIALLTEFDILSRILSISTLCVFAMIPMALLVRRYYSAGDTTASNRNKLLFFIFLIVASSIATTSYWWLSNDYWGELCVTIPIWVLATWGLSACVPEAKRPRKWGVPLVPWIPSASIFINIFLLGTMDIMSFMRYGMFTVFLLVYYVFMGLHASFDSAVGNVQMSITDVSSAERGDANGSTSNLNNGNMNI